MERNKICSFCKNESRMIDDTLYGNYEFKICHLCKDFEYEKRKKILEYENSESVVDHIEFEKRFDVYNSITKGNAMDFYTISKFRLSKLKCMEKRNPHGRDFAPMKLYLRYQVQSICLEKFDTFGELQRFKLQKRNIQFENKRKKLKKEQDPKTNKKVRKIRAPDHEHAFQNISNSNKQECEECGIIVDYEEI